MADYTTSTNKLKVTELDFDAIKTALKTYLQGQDDFKDYNYDGSAISILLDVLAYNTHYNGFYINMLASEMFMDSASLRSSVVSLAKHLGYTPSSRRGASVYVDITLNGSGTALTIPKNAKFTSKIGNDVHTFLTTEAHTANYDSTDGTYKALQVELKEGVSFYTSYTVQGTNNEIFEIPNENVDTSTISVAVGGAVYTKVDDITELTSTSKVYYLQEGNQNTYEIYFGDGVNGVKPSNGDLVEISYNASSIGLDGNGATSFSLAEALVGATSATVTLSSINTRSFGGAERETVSSIRTQAPRQYASQKRVVTTNDYKTRLENDYNLVDSVRVWGGEENNPPEYGVVYVSVKPKSGYVLSEAEKTRLSEDILKKRNVVTVRPKFVSPDYLFVIVDATVSYDLRRTTRTVDQIKSIAKASISNYSSVNLSKFDQYFRYSVLSRVIDDSESGITNNNMVVAMKKRIRPVLRVEGTYRMHFDNAIHRPHKGHTNVIQSSLFTYRGNRNCYIIDRDGFLMVVSSSRADSTNVLNTVETDYGEMNILNPDVGSVNYETGEMFIGPFRPTTITDGSPFIYISAKPRIDDILGKENTIITIEPNDITVNCVDDTDRIPSNRVRDY